MKSYLAEVTDGLVVRAGISVTWTALSWSGGHEFEPWLGWTWGAWYFCSKSYSNQKYLSIYLSVCLSFCPSRCMSRYLSAFLPACLSVCWSISVKGMNTFHSYPICLCSVTNGTCAGSEPKKSRTARIHKQSPRSYFIKKWHCLFPHWLRFPSFLQYSLAWLVSPSWLFQMHWDSPKLKTKINQR